MRPTNPRRRVLNDIAVKAMACTLALAATGAFAAGIDTHMHIDAVTQPPGGTLDFSQSAGNLVSAMDALGVDQAVVMPPPQSLGQSGAYTYEALLDALNAFPDRLLLAAGGGTLNPIIHSTAADEVTPAIEAAFRSTAEAIVAAGARAFGEMTALHLCFTETHHFLEAPPDHPLFLLLADIAAEHGLPIDLHMEAVLRDMPLPDGFAEACSKNPPVLQANVAALDRLLRHNREAKIVWQHVGWDNTGNLSPLLVYVLMTRNPNLYIALRVEERSLTLGGEPKPNPILDPQGNLDPDWAALIERFPDRVMIGGDEFIGVPGTTPVRPQSFEETWAMTDQLPASVVENVRAENARRLYGD